MGWGLRQHLIKANGFAHCDRGMHLPGDAGCFLIRMMLLGGRYSMRFRATNGNRKTATTTRIGCHHLFLDPWPMETMWTVTIYM